MTEGKLARIKRKRKIEELSWGLTFRLTDLILLSLFLGLTLSMPSRHTGKFLAKVLKKIKANIDEEKIKRAVYQLRKSGLIAYGQSLWLDPQITEAGKARLKAIMPQYDPVRAWDKKFYLITYDIPEKRRRLRDRLREFLKTIGCGLLQESIWITPYNPTEIIKEYASANNLENLILISNLGKDGQIGQEDIRDLINRVYRLDTINQRYRQFIESNDQIKVFLAILKDDPQLPFELLPDDWQGEKAWEKIQPLLK